MQQQHTQQTRRRSYSLHVPHNYSSKCSDGPKISRDGHFKTLSRTFEIRHEQ